MLDSKLGHDEQLRLEALKQAIYNDEDATDTVLARAKKFETYIQKGSIDNG